MIRSLHSVPFLLLAFIAGIGPCAGQSVLSASGGSVGAGATRITYTVGEPLIATVGTGTNQLTQGFNQPWVDINTALDDPGITVNTITVYPNPASHVLNLAFREAPVDHGYELFDALGKRLLDGRVQGTITELNMDPFASGGYFLRVFGPDNVLLRSFKISVTH